MLTTLRKLQLFGLKPRGGWGGVWRKQLRNSQGTLVRLVNLQRCQWVPPVARILHKVIFRPESKLEGLYIPVFFLFTSPLFSCRGIPSVVSESLNFIYPTHRGSNVFDLNRAA